MADSVHLAKWFYAYTSRKLSNTSSSKCMIDLCVKFYLRPYFLKWLYASISMQSWGFPHFLKKVRLASLASQVFGGCMC
jgi:hypothetical protein